MSASATARPTPVPAPVISATLSAIVSIPPFGSGGIMVISRGQASAAWRNRRSASDGAQLTQGRALCGLSSETRRDRRRLHRPSEAVALQKVHAGGAQKQL